MSLQDGKHNNSAHDEEEFHPDSKWQEPLGTDGNGNLTLYDIHRKPRTINIDPDAQRSRVPLKLLHPDFRCPICMSYLNETVMVKECMHRFCRRCIIECIGKGKKECPTCRIHLPSKRYLRADTRFDSLIKCILGDAQEQDESELRHLQEMNNISGSGASAVPVTRRSSRRGSVAKRRKVGSYGEPEEETRRLGPSASSAPIEDFELSPLVQFLLVRHPDETTLEPLLKDSIQMSGDAPVSVLQSFLCKKLSCGSPASDFEILIRMEGTCVVLNPTLHLGNVKREFCSTLDETMVLYYRLK